MTETLLKYGSKIIVLLLCIPIHEFAHAWAADRLGDPTPRYQGRLTVNPLAHLTPLGSLMIILIGFGYGKPVSVNPMNFRQYRKGMALTAAAGPIANFIMAFLFMILYKVFYALYAVNLSVVAYFYLAFIFEWIAIINLGLAVFNLIPVYPLDGQKILAYFTSAKFNRFMQTYENYIAIGFIVLLVSGLLDGPLNFLNEIAFFIMDKLTFWVDIILNAFIH